MRGSKAESEKHSKHAGAAAPRNHNTIQDTRIWVRRNLVQKRSQKFMVMKFGVFEGESCEGFCVWKSSSVNFPPPPPKKKKLRCVTKSFATFFTLKFNEIKEICHLVHLEGTISRQKSHRHSLVISMQTEGIPTRTWHFACYCGGLLLLREHPPPNTPVRVSWIWGLVEAFLDGGDSALVIGF